MAFTKNRDEPIYTISVAAKLVRPPSERRDPAARETQRPIHAQTLRMYDKMGLVRPRKVGKNRFYSDRDIERLQQIQHFTQKIGINLAGVSYIFALMDQLQQLDSVSDQIDALLHEAEERVAALSHGDKDEDQNDV